jgi:hypothetical protein
MAGKVYSELTYVVAYSAAIKLAKFTGQSDRMYANYSRDVREFQALREICV